MRAHPLRNRRNVRLYRKRFYRKRWFVYSVATAVVCAVFGVLAVLLFLRPYFERAQQFDLSLINELEVASVIYDRHGREVGRLFEDENRELVDLDDVPRHLIEALLSAEDSRFYRHSGVDFLGIARAAYLNFRAGGVTQGASTITQQLARNAFDLREDSMDRKLVEAFLANRIEQQFTKPQILEMYLNRIFFGPGAYGIRSASRRYFGKEPRDLTIEESATICGLIKSPVRLSPLRNPEASLRARNHVLNRMRIDGFITPDQYAELIAKPIVTRPDPLVTRYPYAYEEIRMRLLEVLDEVEVKRGGFHIFTTLDAGLQRSAEEVLREQLARVEAFPQYEGQTLEEYERIVVQARAEGSPVPTPTYLQGAALVIDNETGGVLAMVGGRNYAHSQFNIAMRARRAAGTGFLPFLHAAAYSHGAHPGTPVLDEPIDNNRVMIGGLVGILGEWGAEDPSHLHEMREIPARQALSGSKLAASFRLAESVGRQRVIELARRAGFRLSEEQARRPATVLGQFEATLAEYCLAYSAFPGGGERPERLQLIRRVLDRDGREIFRAGSETPRVRVMDGIAAHQTWTGLRETLESGTAAEAWAQFDLIAGDIGGQTSTSYGFTDNWFVGSSDKVTVGVWCGFIRPRAIFEGAFSRETVMPAWVGIMNEVAVDWPPAPLPPPEGAVRVAICRVSGLPATDYCYDRVPMSDGGVRFVSTAREEYFRPGMEPEGSCGVHRRDSDLLATLMQRQRSVAPTETEGPTRAQAEAVVPQAPLLIGVDPYQSLQPVLARPEEEQVQAALPVMRARAVGDLPGEGERLQLPRPGRVPLLED